MPATDRQISTKSFLCFLMVLGVSLSSVSQAFPAVPEDLSSDAGRTRLVEAASRKQSRSPQEGCPAGRFCKRSSEPSKLTAPEDPKAGKVDFQTPGEDAKSAPDCPHGVECQKIPTNHKGRFLNTLRACPYGLWCQKGEEQNKRPNPSAHQAEKRLDDGESRSDGTRQDTSESGEDSHCPPGLWCKRNGPNIQIERDYGEHARLGKRPGQCSFDLWCSQKRSFGFYDSRVIRGCPPGLWCRRRRFVLRPERASIDEVTN